MNEFKVTVNQDVIGTVQQVAEQDGQYGTNYRITVVDDQGHQGTILEQKARVDRELQHRSINRDLLIGRRCRFWKKPMEPGSSKGYFSIDLLDAQRVSPPSNNIAGAVQTITQKAEAHLPGWLDKENKEAQIKERARQDFEWAWNTAKAIMGEDIEVVSNVQAVQAAAVGLTIRLEHERR